MKDWHVGQRVVCVSDNWVVTGNENAPIPPDPIIGGIYTIRGIVAEPEMWVGIRLEEIINPLEEEFEAVYEADGFRPVKETDISIFTKMLKPKETQNAL